MRVGVGAEPVVAAGGRRVGWFAPFRLVFRFGGLARLAGWGGRGRLVVPFFSGQQQRAQRGGGHVQRVQQALGVAVGFAFVAAAVGGGSQQRGGGSGDGGQVAQREAQAQADDALLQHGAGAVAVLHVADFMGEHAHERFVARAGGAAGQLHHRVGHDDGAAGHGEGVGRHAGAKAQLQRGRVAAVVVQGGVLLHGGGQAGELRLQLSLARGRNFAGLEVAAVQLIKHLPGDLPLPGQRHGARQMAGGPGRAVVVEGPQPRAHEQQHAQQRRPARLHFLGQRGPPASGSQGGLPGGGIVHLQAAVRPQVDGEGFGRAARAPAFGPLHVFAGHGKGRAAFGAQPQHGALRTGLKQRLRGPRAGAAAIEPVNVQGGHRGALRSDPAPAHRPRRRRKRLAGAPFHRSPGPARRARTA